MATIWLDAAATGGGSGTEANPYNSYSAALAAMSPGDTMRVVGGIIPAPINGPPSGANSGATTKIIGDPGNPFVVSGGVSLGNLGQCVSDDEQYVGATNRANIYKITVPNSIFPNSDPENAALYENGEQLTICVERDDESDTFFITKPSYYHTADSVTLSGANVTGFKLPSVTDLYTKAQLDNSICHFVTSPNVAAKSAVNFDTGTDVIGLVTPATYEDSTVKDNFALFNLLPSMKAGEFGYRDLGNGTSVIYVWPFSAASISANLIEYASASIGINLDGLDNIEMSGFCVRQISMPSKTSTAAIYSNQFDNHAENVHLYDFEVKNCTTTADSSMILMSGVDDLWMHDFKLSRCQGGFGVFLQGSGAGRADWPRLRMAASVSLNNGVTITGQTTGATATVNFTTGTDIYLTAADTNKPFAVGETVTASGYSGTVANITQMDNQGDASLVVHMMRSHVHDFEIEYMSSATIRGFTCRNAAIHHGYIHEASEESHGNTIYFYQGSHNCLMWGINGEGSGGYATWQESTDLVTAFCAYSASTAPFGGQRAIQQQQNRFSQHPGEVYGYEGAYVLNTRGVPEPSRMLDERYGNGFDISSANAPNDLWTVWNCIYHGSSSESGAALTDWDYSINTRGSGIGSALRGPNEVNADWSTTYTDAENGDFSYPTGAIVRTFTGRDWSSLITGFKARWPFVNTHATALGITDPFTLDLAKDAINWTNLRAGPVGNMNFDISTNGGGVVAPPDPVITQINAGNVTISLASPVTP